jgi:hypothetical protein
MLVQPASRIFIKTRLQETISVIMAEAAAITLAAKFNFQVFNFLRLPYSQITCSWFIFLASITTTIRMKTFTQEFDNSSNSVPIMLYKISRDKNIVADTLARQALNYQLDLNRPTQVSCTYGAHDSQCFVLQTNLIRCTATYSFG